MITNLSDYGWYPSEYKIDIHERLKVLEKERHVFQNRSPQVFISINLYSLYLT